VVNTAAAAIGTESQAGARRELNERRVFRKAV
jgi:hypothetical protein